MKMQRNITQMKEQIRNTEVQINEEEIGKLPEKEFRIMIVKIIKNLEKKMEKMQESINKDLKELKNKHTETNNTIIEIKNNLEGINRRISEAEEQIMELEDKMVEITSEEQNKVKRMKRTEDSLRDLCSVQFSSVAQSCPTLCKPMNRSTPGLPVHHRLPEFTSLFKVNSD